MITTTNSWKSNGKLLLTGEYLVMEGALALAIPLKKGQTLCVNKNDTNILSWKASKPSGSWFTADYELPSLNIVHSDNKVLADRLKDILNVAQDMSDDFLVDNMGTTVNTLLDFDPEFGFGSSSTLISNIAMWAKVNPYSLLENTFGGSGYDIACARSKNPIVYQRLGDNINVLDVGFDPIFKENLFFVYLGRKQSSANSISNFKKHCNYTSVDVDAISDITKELLITSELTEFEALLAEHESIMTSILNIQTAKSLHFPDFNGFVKSLGAWGGDFVMVTCNSGEKELRNYMRKRGFETVFSYSSIAL